MVVVPEANVTFESVEICANGPQSVQLVLLLLHRWLEIDVDVNEAGNVMEDNRVSQNASAPIVRRVLENVTVAK